MASFSREDLMHMLIEMENKQPSLHWPTLYDICGRLCGKRCQEIFLNNTDNGHNAHVLTKIQREKMLHALGWSHTPKLSKLGWRNYYMCDFDAHMEALIPLGFVEKFPHGNGYLVTKAGMIKLGMSKARALKVWVGNE